MVKPEVNDVPMIMPRGATIPQTSKYPPYESAKFSGTGWRYSGYRFIFKDYKKDYLFGVTAIVDSFLFYTFVPQVGYGSTTRSYVVPATGATL